MQKSFKKTNVFLTSFNPKPLDISVGCCYKNIQNGKLYHSKQAPVFGAFFILN